MKNIKKRIKSIINFVKADKIMPVYQTTNQVLKNKVALISGGCGGIGYAIAKTFINSGCKVIIAGTNEDKCINCCKKLGANCKYIIINLKEIHTFKDKINQAANLWGGVIDIYVNSAGIHVVRSDLDFINITEEEYDEIMDINLKGTYFMCQEMGKYMIKNKLKGHILIISSQSALEPAWSPYRLSKWGIKGITAGIAQKLISYGIVVNAIAPGPTATSMQSYSNGDSIHTDGNQIERYTMPEEIAEYAKMLCSDLGNTIVGDTIYMSGGRGIIEIR